MRKLRLQEFCDWAEVKQLNWLEMMGKTERVEEYRAEVGRNLQKYAYSFSKVYTI